MNDILDIINVADNLPNHPGSTYPTQSPDGLERYVPFQLSFADFEADIIPMGLLRPLVLFELQQSEANFLVFHKLNETDEVFCVSFADHIVELGGEEMGRLLQEVSWRWKQEDKFKSQLTGWRNELFQIHASPESTFFAGKDITAPSENKVFALERSACALFGFVTYGVHLTAYEGEGDEMKIWVAQRSLTKATYPGMLDNTVAGGVSAGRTPDESLLVECMEEASLPEPLIRSKVIQSKGFVSLFHITPEGWLQPQMGFVYDLQLPPKASPEYIKPKTNDDEVESFTLIPIAEVELALRSKRFKPNCGAVVIDFLLRHDLLSVESDTDKDEVAKRLRRGLTVAGPVDI